MPRSGKNQGKTIIFQGQGKVREFCKRSGEILEVVKVSEKSGNLLDLLVKSNALCTKSHEKRKAVENEEKNIDGLLKKLKQM